MALQQTRRDSKIRAQQMIDEARNMTKQNKESQRRIMRLPEVIEKTGYKRQSIYNFMKAGTFPQARRIGPRAVGWDSLEVEAWIAKQLDCEE